MTDFDRVFDWSEQCPEIRTLKTTTAFMLNSYWYSFRPIQIQYPITKKVITTFPLKISQLISHISRKIWNYK